RQEQSAKRERENFIPLGSSNRKSKIENPKCFHLITLSALASTFGGIVKPICFAAFRLMMNSNFVGCSTGSSAGLAPFKILSTYVAARRYKSVKFAAYDMRPPAST